VNSVTGLGFVFNEGGKRSPLLYWLVKLLYRFALARSQVIFQNPDDQKLFLENGLIKEQQTHLIRSSGVDPARFFPSPEPGGVPVVILAARLLWDKGVGEFVEAARLIQQRGIDARFVLCGSSDPGNPTGIPEAQLAVWQQEAVVELWGWSDQMERVYPRAAVVCLPSRYREGVPRSLVEAAACGRALVATDIPGSREIVKNGVNGLLVPPCDAQALAEAIYQLLVQPALRAEMADRSREIMVEGFSVQKVVSGTMQVYSAAKKRSSS
jgi:glycosyltransferase involved in cell wall biosynthesis